VTAARTSTLQTDRADIARTRWHEAPHVPLEPGRVRLRVEHFGLSANNATYATLGDAMHYWDFFPQEDPAWGCVPVWGHATVTESRSPDVPVGRRIFGFLPFATDVVMTPRRVGSGGFVDGTAHRAELPAPYNSYTDVDVDSDSDSDSDSGHRRELEAYDALLRPLFTTSFLIADWLVHERHFGAETVLLSSASSKTAYGTAHALGQAAGPRPEVVGLTSAAHVASTRRLGLYDRVLGYDQIDSLDPGRPTVYVDLSGSAAIRAAVHTRCAGLRHDCAVGLTHWQDTAGSQTLPGPDPVFFFAPAELERQVAQLGRAELSRRIGEAMTGFVAKVSDPASPLMNLTWHRGRDAAAAAYLDVVLGRTEPAEGVMVTL
jgi:Protein of unknown function (DUF2855)